MTTTTHRNHNSGKNHIHTHGNGYHPTLYRQFQHEADGEDEVEADPENEQDEDDVDEDDDEDDDVDEWEEEDDFDEGEIPLPPTMSSFRRGNSLEDDMLRGDTDGGNRRLQNPQYPQRHYQRQDLLPGPTREEYERTILKLGKLNATLTANVAALYAENAAASVSSSSSSFRRCADPEDARDNSIEEGEQVEEEELQDEQVELEVEEEEEIEQDARGSANFGRRKRVTMELTPNEEYNHYGEEDASAAAMEGDHPQRQQQQQQQLFLDHDGIMNESSSPPPSPSTSSSPYTHQYYVKLLAKSERTNEKLKKQLAAQKKLVGQLSVNLKVAAEKIMELHNANLNGGGSDRWNKKKENEKDKEKSKEEVSVTEKGVNTEPLIDEDDRHHHHVMERRLQRLQHQYQRQRHQYQSYRTQQHRHLHEVRTQLQSFHSLLVENSLTHDEKRERLLSNRNDGRNEDVHPWNATNTSMFAEMETPEEIMQRIICNLRGDAVNGAAGGDGGGNGGNEPVGSGTATAKNTASAMDFSGLRIGDGVARTVEIKDGAVAADDADANADDADDADIAADDNHNDADEIYSGIHDSNDSSHQEKVENPPEENAVSDSLENAVYERDVVCDDDGNGNDNGDDDDTDEDMNMPTNEEQAAHVEAVAKTSFFDNHGNKDDDLRGKDIVSDDDGEFGKAVDANVGNSGQVVDQDNSNVSLSIPHLDEEGTDQISGNCDSSLHGHPPHDDSKSEGNESSDGSDNGTDQISGNCDSSLHGYPPHDGGIQLGGDDSGNHFEPDSKSEGNESSDARDNSDIESDDDLEEPAGNVIHRDQRIEADDDDSCVEYGATAQDPRQHTEMDDDSEESLPCQANSVSHVDSVNNTFSEHNNDTIDDIVERESHIDTTTRARDPPDLGFDHVDFHGNNDDDNDNCDDDLEDPPAHRTPDSGHEECKYESDESVEDEARSDRDDGGDQNRIVDQDNVSRSKNVISAVDTRGAEPDRHGHESVIHEMYSGHENPDETGCLGERDFRIDESDDESNEPISDVITESSETARGRDIDQHCDETSAIDANSDKSTGQAIPNIAEASSLINPSTDADDRHDKGDITEQTRDPAQDCPSSLQPSNDPLSRDDESQNAISRRYDDEDDQSIDSAELDSNVHIVHIDRGSFNPDEISESCEEQVNTSLLQSDRDVDVPYGKNVQSFHSEGIDSCMEEVNTYLLKTDEDSYSGNQVHGARETVDQTEMTEPLPKKGVEIGIQVGKGLCDGDITLDGKYPDDPQECEEEQNLTVPVEINPDDDYSNNFDSRKPDDESDNGERSEINPQSEVRKVGYIDEVANTARIQKEDSEATHDRIENSGDSNAENTVRRDDAMEESKEPSASAAPQTQGDAPPETENYLGGDSEIPEIGGTTRDGDSNENDERSQSQGSVESEATENYRSPESSLAAVGVQSRVNDESNFDSPIDDRIRRKVSSGRLEDNSDVVMDLYDESDDEFAAQNDDQPGEDDYVAKEGKDTDGVCSVASGAFGEDESIDSGSYEGLNGVPAYINADGMNISDSGKKDSPNTLPPSSVSGSQVGGTSSVKDSVKKFNEKLERKMTQARDDKSMKSWTMSTVYTNETRDISVYSKSAFSKLNKDDPLSTRLSRKQLFQHAGSSFKEFLSDPNNTDNNEDDSHNRTVLIRARDKKSLVPPYKPPGFPEIKLEDGPIFSKDKGDGYYVYKSSSGNEYRGNWKDGRRHGQGLAKYRDGEVYIGEWKRGRRHGHGVLHLANSEVFDGGWDANKKHGLGIYFWADGEADVSWYEYDQRKESIRWTKDRRRSYRLDLASSRKDQISLTEASKIVKRWQRKSFLHG